MTKEERKRKNKKIQQIIKISKNKVFRRKNEKIILGFNNINQR